MRTTDMRDQNKDLVKAAADTISARYRPDWHVVGAALRLRTGEIVTGVHLDANVGRIAVCAEAIALGRAVTEHGSSDVDTIVAVYRQSDGRIRVVAPCGMCREMIADYAPDARVLILADEAIVERTIRQLLPEKYSPC
jgi:cytidine deaminase